MSKLKINTASLQSLIDKANALPEATTLDVLSNPGSASTMLEGTEMLDGEGKKVIGTIETKTSSNLTANGANVTVPAGYYANQAAKSVTTTTQATPSIAIDSTGTILVTVNQTEGYVTAGTKLSHKKMTTQAAQTITPGTSDQTIASGKYLTGTQTIKGDANLVAGNIAKDVTIFGVTGTHEGGEDVSAETAEYTSLLTDLETAINALPDAGSGGVETCTITLASGGPPPPVANDDIIYVDATQTLQKVVHQFGVPYEVVKGSIVVFYGNSFSYPAMNMPTGIECVCPQVYFVTGDATLEIS